MKRRGFLSALFGGAVALGPVGSRAQQKAMPVIGFLNSRSAADTAHLLARFRKGLAEHGYVEGQNAAIEYRWANGQYERLPALALELVDRRVALLVATGGEPVAAASKTATSTIPIVFLVGGDPVRMGLAASFSRPGGNSTGVSMYTSEIGAKRLGLLRPSGRQHYRQHDIGSRSGAETVAAPQRGAAASCPRRFPVERKQRVEPRLARRTARRRASLGVTVIPVEARTDADFEAAMHLLAEKQPDAVLATNDPVHQRNMPKIVEFQLAQRIPGMFQLKEQVAAGGLISYGASLPDLFRRGAGYAHRILRGTAPADLPVEQPTNFELVINLKTAKVLGLTVPQALLARADEVIE